MGTDGSVRALTAFQLNIMASFAQFERSIAKERQAEGIPAVKARGVYTGRTRKLTATQPADAREQISAGVPKAAVSRRLGINRTTLHRALHATQTSSDTGAADLGKLTTRVPGHGL